MGQQVKIQSITRQIEEITVLLSYSSVEHTFLTCILYELQVRECLFIYTKVYIVSSILPTDFFDFLSKTTK